MRGKSYLFTNEQIEYIINNWGKESPYSMRKKFGCSWEAVCKVAEEHGLEVSKSNRWTKEEVTTIMDKTEKAVAFEVQELGCKRGNIDESYMRAKKNVFQYSLDEFKSYFAFWREEGNEQALFCILDCYMDLIDYFVNKNLVNDLDKDDFLSAGKEGLVQAIQTFDYIKEDIKHFYSYAVNFIKKYILMELRAYKKYYDSFLFEDIIHYTKEGKEIYIEDLIGMTEEDVFKESLTKIKREMMNEILQSLTYRERQIILLRYGFGQTQNDVAKVFACSKYMISQQERKILVKMKQFKKVKQFKDLIEE